MHVPDHVREDLMSRANVVGVGTGPKRRNGRETGEEAVIVFVTEKLPESELAEEDICPKTVDIDGEEAPTDVVQTGDVWAQATTAEPAEPSPDRTKRFRPAPASVSVGHPDVTAGTLGSPPLETEAGPLVFLTNTHVAAPPPDAALGDACLQPGPRDGGDTDDRIGTLHDFAAVSRDEPNTSDSALVEVDSGDLRANEILEIGPLAGFRAAAFGEAYEKSGRTTGHTTGELVAEDVQIDVRGYYPNEPVTFTGVDAFTPMSSGGDSGSLIGLRDDGDFFATDLLFAGSPFVTFGIPWDAVVDEHGELSVANPPSSDGGDGDTRRTLLDVILALLRRFFGKRSRSRRRRRTSRARLAERLSF